MFNGLHLNSTDQKRCLNSVASIKWSEEVNYSCSDSRKELYFCEICSFAWELWLSDGSLLLIFQIIISSPRNRCFFFIFSPSLIVPLLQQPLFSNWMSTTQLMHAYVRRNIWRGKLEAWAIWSSVSLIIHVSLLLLFCVLTSLVHTLGLRRAHLKQFSPLSKHNPTERLQIVLKAISGA